MADESQEELKKALDLAVKDGNDRVARQLAERIVSGEPSASVQQWTDASKKRSAVEGSVEGRRRMIEAAKAERGRPGIQEVGDLKDFAKGSARAAEFFLTLPGNISEFTTDQIMGVAGVPEEKRKDILDSIGYVTSDRTNAIKQIWDVDTSEGRNTAMGKLGEFWTGGAVGGVTTIVKATSQYGLKGLAKTLGQNVAGSTAALVGSEAGGNWATDMGLPRIYGEIPGALIPSAISGGAMRIITDASAKERAANSLVAKGRQETADRLGLATSAGINSPNNRTKFLERTLASIPGGMRRMHEFSQKLTAQVESSLYRITSPLRGDAGRESAGLGIVTAANRHVTKFRNRADIKYKRAAAAIPEDQPVVFNRFKDTLDELAPQGTDRVSGIIEAIRSGRKPISPIVREALDKVEAGAPITFKEADSIRRVIGAEINQGSIISNPAHGELKAMYGALSDDIGASLSPTQKGAWDSASDFWRNGRQQIDDLVAPVLGQGGLQTQNLTSAFDRLMAGDGKNVEKLRVFYRSMDFEQRDLATKTLIVRMGKLAEDAQEASNPNFKMGTFISKWKSPAFSSAKKVLFRGMPEFRRDMDDFVGYIDEVIETNAAMANPSQSGPVGLSAATSYYALAGLAGAGLGYAASQDEKVKDAAIGSVVGVAGILMAAKGAGTASTLMTSPKFVSWLARGTKVPANQTANHFARLSVMASEDPYLADAIADFTNQVSAYTAGTEDEE